MAGVHASNSGMARETMTEILLRPEFSAIYMRFARDLAKRSTCERLKVGTVITSIDHRYVYGLGYNGNAAGLLNCCDDANRPGACGCLHSEENAIINCCTDRSHSKIVYITHSPCLLCAKRLINLGNVLCVYFGELYRDAQGLELLVSVGIQAEEIKDERLLAI